MKTPPLTLELFAKLVESDPNDWKTRKKAVKILNESKMHEEAANLLWGAPEIPQNVTDLSYSVFIMSKGQPVRGVRLVSTIITQNSDKPELVLGIAKVLMNMGSSLQAIRLYGAATVFDQKLLDTNFEMSLISADNESKNWHQFSSEPEFPWAGAGSTIEDDLVSQPKLTTVATEPSSFDAANVSSLENQTAAIPEKKVDAPFTKAVSESESGNDNDRDRDNDRDNDRGRDSDKASAKDSNDTKRAARSIPLAKPAAFPSPFAVANSAEE